MSRSEYSYDCSGWDLIMWRGAVSSAIRGKRGQLFLKEMLEALDAIPSKRLIANDFKMPDGEVCALGSVGIRRGTDMNGLIHCDNDEVGKFFGIATALAREIQFVNDNDYSYKKETPEERFIRVRKWVAEQIKVES